MIKQSDLDKLAAKIEERYLKVLRQMTDPVKEQKAVAVALEQLTAIEMVETWASKNDMLTLRKSNQSHLRMKTIKNYPHGVK